MGAGDLGLSWDKNLISSVCLSRELTLIPGLKRGHKLVMRLTAVSPRSGTYTELLGPNFRTQQCFHTTAPAPAFPQFESYQHFFCCRLPQKTLLSSSEYCMVSCLLWFRSRWCEITVVVSLRSRIMVTCQPVLLTW